jgi:hypothetical protein
MVFTLLMGGRAGVLVRPGIGDHFFPENSDISSRRHGRGPERFSG